MKVIWEIIRNSTKKRLKLKIYLLLKNHFSLFFFFEREWQVIQRQFGLESKTTFTFILHTNDHIWRYFMGIINEYPRARSLDILITSNVRLPATKVRNVTIPSCWRIEQFAGHSTINPDEYGFWSFIRVIVAKGEGGGEGRRGDTPHHSSHNSWPL